MAKKKTNSITVEYNQTAKGTKGNDVFHITGATKSATIDLTNSGTDTLYFDVPIQIISDTKAVDGTKDLEIFYTRQDADNPSMIYKLTIKNYFTSTAHTATKSSLKNIHYVSRVDGSEHNGTLIDNVQIRFLYTKKDNVITGSNFSDRIEMSYYNDGFVINGGNGNDWINDSYVAVHNDTINGGKGDDTIVSYGGDDVLTGGAGNNQYQFNANTGNSTVKLTKKESFNVTFENTNAKPSAYNFGKFGYSIDDSGNAIITYDKTSAESGGVTLKGFANKDLTKMATLTLGNDGPLNLKTDVVWDKAITKKYDGSYLSENIDASLAGIQYKTVKKKKVATDLVINGNKGNDTITGSAYNDTINGGAGNDTIIGSDGADKLTGGKGNNRIVYPSMAQVDGDKIYLTKGENLTIDCSSEGFSTASNAKFAVNGNNLDVTLYGTGGEHTFTIMDFGAKDVANTTVTLKRYGESDLNLREDIVATSTKGTWHSDIIDKSSAKKAVKINGGNGNDNITGSAYNDTLNGDKGNDKIFGGDGKDTINGGAGHDLINGGAGKDTIKGGSGNDTITGGAGNDKIYGEAGNNTLIFNAGDGKDTVYSGKGTDTLKFADISPDDVKFKKSGTSLIVNYNHNEQGVAQDSVTIKDYYNKKGKAASSVKFIEVGGREYNLETFKGYADKNAIKASATADIIGDDNDNILIATGTNLSQRLEGQKGNDILYASDNFVEDYLYGGEGNDILYGSNYNGADVNVGQCRLIPGSGQNTVYAGEYCSKYIYLDNQSNTTIYTSSAENNAIGQNAHNFIFLDNHGNKNNSNQHDTIYWRGTSAVQIRTYYNNVDDLTLTRETGNNDLVVRYAGNNSLTFKDYYKAGNEGMSEIGFVTKDFGWISLGGILEHNGGTMTKISGFTGTDGADYIEGTDNAENINGNGGNDSINPLGGDDTIHLGAGNDYLFRGNGNKTIYADSGNNTIWLGSGNNTLYAGTGEDDIYSGTGQDTIEFAAADTGDDVYNFRGRNKTLVFKGDTLSDLTMSHTARQSSGGDVVITRGSNGKKVTFENGYLTTNYNPNITIVDKNGATSTMVDLNTVVGEADYTGVQAITTGKGNDIITIGKANDTVNPGTGTNTIKLVTPVASGNNNIYNYQNGTDTIELPAGTADLSGVILLKQNNDLIIGYNNGDTSNNTLKLENYFETPEIGANITIKAGEVTRTLKSYIDADDYSQVIFCATENHTVDQSASTKAVTIQGCTSADIITGSSYNDTINGKGGGDTLRGGAGSDTYIIETADYGNGQDVISDASGDADKLLLGAYINQNVSLDEGDTAVYFEVTPTGTVTNGNADYNAGNDLYLIKNKNYTFENATTSNGVKIENYFTTGKIEKIRNLDDTKDVFSQKVISAIGQTVANWLRKNEFASTTDAIANATDEQKEALLKIYKPFVSTWSNKSGTNGDDFIILADSNRSQSVYGRAGNDIIFASDHAGDYINGDDGDDIIYGSNNATGDQNNIYTGAGNDIVFAGNDCMKYIRLGDGNDTVYSPSNSAAQIWIDQYATNYNGGNDTIYWLGTSSLELRFFDYNGRELAYTRAGGSDDLVIRYGADNSVTLKDFYKAGNEDLEEYTYINYMHGRGGSTASTQIISQGGVMDYTETASASYDGDENNNYIVAKENGITVKAGEGSDVIVTEGDSTIYTNNIANGKDTTPNTVDRVEITGGAYHNVYAQSRFNVITSNVEGGSSENYYAFIDQATYINDNGGNDDWLILQNTQATTDAIKNNLTVMFDVKSDYTYDGTEASKRLVGDVLVTSNATKDNFEELKDRIAYGFTGVCIKDNNIDKIQSSDSWKLTSADIATLAQDVAGWLSSNGYASVNDVFKGNDAGDISALIAKFNTANWVDISDM